MTKAQNAQFEGLKCCKHLVLFAANSAFSIYEHWMFKLDIGSRNILPADEQNRIPSIHFAAGTQRRDELADGKNTLRLFDLGRRIVDRNSLVADTGNNAVMRKSAGKIRTAKYNRNNACFKRGFNKLQRLVTCDDHGPQANPLRRNSQEISAAVVSAGNGIARNDFRPDLAHGFGDIEIGEDHFKTCSATHSGIFRLLYTRNIEMNCAHYYSPFFLIEIIKNPIKTVNERKNAMTRLAELRTAAGISQQELGRLSGVPQGVISTIENGATKHPRTDTAQKLARALGCTIDELLGEKKEETPCR